MLCASGLRLWITPTWNGPLLMAFLKYIRLADFLAVIDLHDGFYGLRSVRKGGILPCPIFRLGPFDAQTEITFLAPARWDSRLKRVRPFSAVGSAEENLEVLLADHSRRRRG
jgi:hypothetical protein